MIEAITDKVVHTICAAMFGALLGVGLGLIVASLGMKIGVFALSPQEDGHLDWDIPAAFWGAVIGLSAGTILGWRLQPRLDDLRTSQRG